MADPLSFADLREANVERCEAHYHPLRDWSLTDWLTCVAGELGELASEIKNYRRSDYCAFDPPDALHRSAMADEAADVVIYLDLLCACAGIDLGRAVREKFNRVSRERLGSPIVLDTRVLAARVREEPSSDYLVTVCAACLCASCWHGELVCSRSGSAGTAERRASELRALGREHPDHFSREKITRVTGAAPKRAEEPRHA